MSPEFIRELEGVVGAGRVRLMEPMSLHTTFRVGGPADAFVSPRGGELPRCVGLCRERGVPYAVIGNGSNLLVGDGGIRGVVIEIGREMAGASIEGDAIRAGAGASLSRLSAMAAERGLGGLEFAAGIPGTLGGAIVMNAGAYGGEMKDVVRLISVIGEDGEKEELSIEEIGPSYRSTALQGGGRIVTGASLSLSPRDPAEIRSKVEEYARRRGERQPLEYPSAGSTFKRPKGFFAGKLIQDAGLSGRRVGGAQVSEKHCGFVVNRGGATAADILRLIGEVQAEVERQFGVALEPEVKMIGEF